MRDQVVTHRILLYNAFFGPVVSLLTQSYRDALRKAPVLVMLRSALTLRSMASFVAAVVVRQLFVFFSTFLWVVFVSCPNKVLVLKQSVWVDEFTGSSPHAKPLCSEALRPERQIKGCFRAS